MGKLRVAFRFGSFILRGFFTFGACKTPALVIHFSVMETLKLNIVTRELTGRGTARRLRAEGNIPASLYGQGQARSITVSAVAFRDLNRELAGGSSIIELTDEKGETALTLLKSVDHDPIKGTVDHIDFQEVERGQSFNAQVSVHLVGEADCLGVKNDGGLIDHKTHQIDIRCRPSKLPEHVEVDVSGLSVGDAIQISDLAEIEGVEFLNEPAQVLVSIQPPTVAAEPAESEAEEVAADEVPATNVKDDDATADSEEKAEA